MPTLPDNPGVSRIQNESPGLPYGYPNLPDLTDTLVGVLTRFCQEKIAFMSCRGYFFYQVRISLSDRDYLQFLWVPDGDLNRDSEETD